MDIPKIWRRKVERTPECRVVRGDRNMEEAEATGAAPLTSDPPRRNFFWGIVSKHGPYSSPHSLTSSRRGRAGQGRNFGARLLPNPKIAIHLPRVPVSACLAGTPFSSLFLLQLFRSCNRLGTRSRRSLPRPLFSRRPHSPGTPPQRVLLPCRRPPRRASLITPSLLRAAWLPSLLGRKHSQRTAASVSSRPKFDFHDDIIVVGPL